MIRLLVLLTSLISGPAVLAQPLPAGVDPQNTIVIDTNQGRIVIKLRPDLAPRHADRIKQLVRDKFYDDVPFHRVIAGLMAQTGDGQNRNGTGGSKYPNLPAEFSNVPFKRGVVGMARSNDPNSANSQFFIMYADGSFLNGKYTIVGEVVSGMDVVDKIKKGEPVIDPDRMIRVQVAAGAISSGSPSNPRQQTSPPAKVLSSGSGVVIGAQGEILTNSHVVEDCQEITVKLPLKSTEAAILVTRDQKNDLAVVRINTHPTSVALFREGAPLRAGDTVVALGYPLSGLLATTANLTVGNVSALAGLGDDSRYVQISAPVQPGNSGGPLLDASGHLVGIVTAKLNAARVARFTGDIPQNVNFALKAEVARTILDSKGIAYQGARSEQQLSPADVGDMARPFTVYIECKQISSAGVANIALPERSPPSNKPSPSTQRVAKAVDDSFKKGSAAYAAKKYTDAMRWFRRAADVGNSAAMTSIGRMYQAGQGVTETTRRP
jgi:peptidylprolyl isomerase